MTQQGPSLVTIIATANNQPIGKASGDVADIIQRSHTDLSGVAGRIQGLDSEFDDF